MWRFFLASVVLGCGQDEKPGPSSPTDADEDGFEAEVDCDDTDSAVHPEAPELPYDGIDNDCADGDLSDVDADGFDGMDAGGDDCEDEDPTIHPGVEEIPYDDIDQDCSGSDLSDLDGDGFSPDGYGPDDCDDNDSSVYPQAPEVWYDGVDSDCRGDCDYDADHDGSIPEEWAGSCEMPLDCDDEDPQANSQRVESVWPPDGEVDVDTYTQVEVTFNDPEEDATVVLFNAEGQVVLADYGVEVGADQMIMLLFPAFELDSGAEYLVEITHSCGTQGTTFTTR